MSDSHDHLIAAVRRVQALRYAWPSPPDAASARRLGTGSCASKHALLAEEMDALSVPSLPLLVIGPLVPAILADDTRFAEGLDLPEVHECLTVLTPWGRPRPRRRNVGPTARRERTARHPGLGR